MLDQIEIKKLDHRIGVEFPSPRYASAHAAGLDLVACLDGKIVLPPGQAILVGTGIAVHLNDPGYVALIFPRSGNGHKRGMVLGNGTGVIDADYTGELKVSVLNRSHTEPLTIEPGERIAQLVITPVVRPEFIWVEDFSASSDRGSGGFGSSGK